MPNNEQFEEILADLHERYNVEFKQSMAWEKDSKLIKHILAMANVQGGGSIVIGVAEQNNGLVAEGMQPEHETTYKPDEMKDQVAKYADPEVLFRVHFYPAEDGQRYIFIDVNEFDSIPIVCRQDSSKLNLSAGDIYYRSKRGRPSSAKVNNHNDLREIIERSAIKKIRYFQQIGVTQIITSDSDKFDHEIVAPTEQHQSLFTQIINDIHLTVMLQPLRYQPEAIELKNCKTIIEENSIHSKVKFPVPIVGYLERKTECLGNSYVETGFLYDNGSKNFYRKNQEQIWQMYQSGQFILFNRCGYYFSDKKCLSPTELLVTITKLLRFINRLTNSNSSLQSNLLSGIRLKISLNNVENTALSDRYPYPCGNGETYKFDPVGEYVANIKAIDFDRTFMPEQLANSDAEARHLTQDFLQRFGYVKNLNYFELIQENIDIQGW